MASIKKRDDGRYRARYRDDAGKEHARHFARRIDAQNWLDQVTASIRTGTYVDPKSAKTTVGQWSETWLEGYGVHRESTVRQARVHVKHIVAEFGSLRLSAVKSSNVRAWVAKLQREGFSDSYIYALHARLSQIFTDAIHDDLVAKTRALVGRLRSRGTRSPTSRPQSRCGRCTTQCLSTCRQRSCSARSWACGPRRCAACGCRTSTSCAAS